jgi:hypothetical protein
LPTDIKRRALKNAWVKRWKKAISKRPKPIVVIISPNWLRVDRATIFFMSNSYKALAPAMTIVATPAHNK